MPDAIIAADPKLAVSEANANQILWLALTLTPGLGPTRSRRLVEFFGSVDRVFQASLTELEAAGLPVQSAQALATGRSVQLANEEIARATAADVHLVAFDDPAYPARLRQIYDPPLVLYACGNPGALSLPGVAVVGTRHPHALRHRHGRALVVRSRHPGTGHLQRHGQRRRYRRASRRNIRQRQDRGHVRNRGGRAVSERKFPAGRADSGSAAARWFQSFRSEPSPPRRISPFAIALSAEFRWECWWSKPPNTAALASPPAVRWSRVATSMPSPETSLTKIPGDRIR